MVTDGGLIGQVGHIGGQVHMIVLIMQPINASEQPIIKHASTPNTGTVPIYIIIKFRKID